MSSDRTLLSPTATPGRDEPEETLFDGYPALVPSLGALLAVVFTVGLWLIPLWWRSRSRHYRVTTRRIVIELGVLGKSLEQVDLYRVSDYSVERPVSQRLLGTGNLILRTLDKTSPIVALGGIKTDVVALYERVRAATEAEKAKRGAVRLMEVE
jgi:membrane protein YdbS with pleckstrin-like domain